MAEGQTTYSGQRVDELLRCPVCLDRFKDPKILPCQHTLCFTPCLQGLVDFRSRILRCPECRAEHVVPRNGADGFPSNLIISNFLDLQPQPAAGGGEAGGGGSTHREASGACGICEKEGETAKCAHCSKFLCANCRKSHISQMKFDIGRAVNQIRRGLPKLSECIARTEQKSEVVKQHVEAVKSEVRDVIARYVKQLKDREKLLNSELDTFLVGEMRNLRLKQENIEVELASVSSYCDSTEGLLNRSPEDIPDTELVALKAQCSEYMEQIKSADVSSNIDTKLVKLEVQGRQLNSVITNFGSLVVTTPETGAGNDGPTRGSRQTGNQARSRPRWSSPQPLHELYTRDSNTPPPATPGSITPSAVYTSASEYRSNANSVGIGSHNIHLMPSYLRSTYRRPSPSPAPETSASTNRYMYRMGTSPDSPLQTLLQLQRMEDALGDSPRQGRISAIFGSYTPTPDSDERPTVRQIERSPSVINDFHSHRPPNNRGRGQNRSNIQVAPLSRTSNNPGVFPGRSTYPDVESMDLTNEPNTAQVDDIEQRSIDNRQAVAFSVQFDEGSNRRGRNRRSQRNRSRGSRSRNQNPGRRRESEGRDGGQPSTSTHGAPSSEPPPAPPPRLTRTRTFTMEGTENANSNNNNNSTDVDVSRPSIDTDSDDLDNVHIGITGDDGRATESLTVSRASIQYRRKGQVRLVIGGVRSEEPGKFTWPRGVAVAHRNDSIVVADSSNHRVQVFDCNGEFINQFGTFGTAAGEFDCLAGVTCNPNGDIIVSDRYNHRIQIFDRYGHLQKTFAREGIGQGQLSHPWGVASDNDDNIYVVDKENHRVQVFTGEGNFLRLFGSFGEGPGQFNSPTYIALTPDGKVVVSDTDNHRIQVYHKDGRHLNTFGTHGSENGQMQKPKGVAVDKQGFIVVADSGNARLQVFRGDGRYFASFGSRGNENNQFKGIEGVGLMSDGRVVVCDKENHRLQIF